MAYVEKHEFSWEESGASGTYVPASGSNRFAIIVLCHGYDSIASDPFPATLTWGGQSIAKAGSALMESNAVLALYTVPEATIASLSGGAYTMTLQNSPNIDLGAGAFVLYDGIDQTAGAGSQPIIDSDGTISPGSSPFTLTLTVASGDICIGFAACRGTYTLSAPTGTERVNYMPGTGTSADGVAFVVDYTAAGTSQDVQVGTTGPTNTVFAALAIRPTSGPPPVTITPDRTATPRGYARGNHRGTN